MDNGRPERVTLHISRTAGDTAAQRRAHAWVYCNNEVMNGGHQQFLINSTGLIWKETLEFFDMVGAVKFSNRSGKLVRAFGGSIPFDRKERCDAFDRLWDRDGGRENDFMRLLSRLDDEYFKTDISDRLLAMPESYMRSHPQEFVLEGDYEFFKAHIEQS